MTPAIKAADSAGIRYHIHTYVNDPAQKSYGLEAAEKLNVPLEQVFKTLIVQLDSGELVVAVLPVGQTLNLKSLAKAAKSKKASMAPAIAAERSSGYVLGGVSPLGQKKQLRTFIDCRAEALQTLYVSAGRRGLEIELSPNDLQRLCAATVTQLSLPPA